MLRSILALPIRIIKLVFRLVIAVMRILFSVFGFLMPQNRYRSKSKRNLDSYAKEAWVKSGK